MMNVLLTTFLALVVALLLIGTTFAESLRGGINNNNNNEEVAASVRNLDTTTTTMIMKEFVMTIDAMEPSDPDLLTCCVTDQMTAVLQAWAESAAPAGATLVDTNTTIYVVGPDGTRDLATTTKTTIHVSVSLSGSYTCGSLCGNARRDRRHLQTTASVSMVKVLLPLVCPEINNITTVNMTLTSYRV